MIPCEVKSRCELIDLYNSCDIFLFLRGSKDSATRSRRPSCRGKPVVCTNGSSLPELVMDGSGGLLCEQDNVDDFVDKVKALGRNEQLGQSMGQFNRQRIVNNFRSAKWAPPMPGFISNFSKPRAEISTGE